MTQPNTTKPPAGDSPRSSEGLGVLLLRKRYRIVRDEYLGFEVQIWRWWFPIWVQAGDIINTHSSEELAIEYAKRHAQRVVRNLGPL